MATILCLRIPYSVKLKLLFSDHLQHAVDLCFLLLFQLVVNFTQARLSLMVVGVSSRYCGSSSYSRRTGRGIAVTECHPRITT